jgi:tetratricopeptide (TPR) repeat protein
MRGLPPLGALRAPSPPNRALRALRGGTTGAALAVFLVAGPLRAASDSERTPIDVRSPAVAARSGGVAARKDDGYRFAATISDADTAARAAFHLAESEEQQRKYESALGHYRDVLRIDPGNWFASAARARIEVLSLFEGSFAELAALNAVRHDPARSNDPAAVDELEKQSSNWRGRVRAEALLFVAEARIGRFGDVARGVDPALAVARSDADRVLRDAAWDLASVALRRTDLSRAKREIADDPRAPAAIRKSVLREVRRRTLHRASLGVVGMGSIMLLGALVVAARRGRFEVFRRTATRPLALAFLIVTPVFAGLIADAWERGMGAHFAPFALGLFVVHLLASAWRGAFGDRGRAVRVFGGIAAALCVLAAAYLVLERGEAYGAPLLEGFGL